MHSSYTVHHPPVAVAPHTTTSVTTSTTVSRPALPSMSATQSLSALSSSLSRTSRLDQALLLAGVVTFTSAAAYAAYSYWQRASTPAKPATAAASKQSQHQQQQQPATEYAAATAQEQLTKPLTTLQQPTNTTPAAATIFNLPSQLHTRLSTAGGILFDLDGTLVESAEIWYRLINGASRQFGYDAVSYDEWKATFGQSMERNVEMWMSGLDQAHFNRYCDEHYADHLEHLHILDGSIDLLELVNRKYGRQHVAIVTNCPRKITEIILSHLNLHSYFAHVVCAGDTLPTSAVSPAISTASYPSSGYYSLQPKPAIDILLQGAHRLAVQARDCVFVGDSRYDMLSGRAAGCTTVGVGIKTGDVYVKDTREAVTLFELA